jgi:hypothetical protein
MFPVITDKVTNWLIFGALFAMLPVLCHAILLCSVVSPVTYDALFGNGDCFLFATGIATNAVGELVLSISKKTHRRRRQLAVGVNLLVVVAGVSWYSTNARAHTAAGARSAANNSLAILVVSIVTGGVGVALSEERK